MPLTPEDVANKRFTTTRFRPGYDEDEVDAFLDEVEAELTRLVQENKTLAARAAGAAISPTPGAPTPAAPPEAEPEPATLPAPPAEPEGGQDAALRTLLLAQRTADEAIVQARKEAEQIVTEARTRASGLEQEAQQRHAEAMAEMERRRRELERQVEDLRSFEREYRTRLKAYLETQLRELSGRGVGADGPTSSTSAQPSAPTPTPAAPAAAPAGPPIAPVAPSTAPPVARPGGPGSSSPFGPAPTFGRPGEQAGTSPSAPTPSGPPRQADGPDAPDADAAPGMEVDQGPEVPPSAG
jgi:DivIVA domain-containing protein